MNGTGSGNFESSLRALGNALTWRLTQRRKQNSLIKLQSGRGGRKNVERKRKMTRQGKIRFDVFSPGVWQAEKPLLCKLIHLNALVFLHTVHKHTRPTEIPLSEQTRLPVALCRTTCTEPLTLVRRARSGYTPLCRLWPWLLLWTTRTLITLLFIFREHCKHGFLFA